VAECGGGGRVCEGVCPATRAHKRAPAPLCRDTPTPQHSPSALKAWAAARLTAPCAPAVASPSTARLTSVCTDVGMQSAHAGVLGLPPANRCQRRAGLQKQASALNSTRAPVFGSFS
jgi:hypothetical protein